MNGHQSRIRKLLLPSLTVVLLIGCGSFVSDPWLRSSSATSSNFSSNRLSDSDIVRLKRNAINTRERQDLDTGRPDLAQPVEALTSSAAASAKELRIVQFAAPLKQ